MKIDHRTDIAHFQRNENIAKFQNVHFERNPSTSRIRAYIPVYKDEAAVKDHNNSELILLVMSPAEAVDMIAKLSAAVSQSMEE